MNELTRLVVFISLVFVVALIILFICLFIYNFIRRKFNNISFLNDDQKTALTFGAILAIRNGRNFSSLKGARGEDLIADRFAIGQAIISDWSIYNYQDFIYTVNWLRYEGHRKSIPFFDLDPKFKHFKKFSLDDIFREFISSKKNSSLVEDYPDEFLEYFKSLDLVYKTLVDSYHYNPEILNGLTTIAAWDLERLINLSIWGHVLKYQGELETWEFIESAINSQMDLYKSWEEYFAAFHFGRAMWNFELEFSQDYIARILILDKNSIYKKIDYPKKPLVLT